MKDLEKKVYKHLKDRNWHNIYALEMSVLLGLDTRKIIHKKLAHANKKYPAKLMRGGKAGPGTGSDGHYWRIKKEYRKNKNK
mgnify:CR=1 FL=1